MGQLFGRERSVITKHVRNVFLDGELDRGAMCKICTSSDRGREDVNREVDRYNLDVIISVGSLNQVVVKRFQ